MSSEAGSAARPITSRRLRGTTPRPSTGETLVVRTWPTGVERRPVRLQSVFDLPGVGEAHRSLEADIDKLPALEAAGRETPVIVRLSDLDANGHANNARIAEWIVEGVGRDAWQGSLLRGFDVDYMAEAMHGDTIMSRSIAASEGEHLHSLVRSWDGREIARGWTWWTPR